MWLLTWSHARFDLGISDEEFWSLTPRQLQYLDKQWHRRQTREEFYMGRICEITANFGFRSPKEPFKATDFMPSYQEPVVDEPDDLSAHINAMLRPRAIPKKD